MENLTGANLLLYERWDAHRILLQSKIIDINTGEILYDFPAKHGLRNPVISEIKKKISHGIYKGSIENKFNT